MRRPAARNRAIVSLTPAAGGSASPRNPTNARPRSASSDAAFTSPAHTASTRRPCAASLSFTATRPARCSPSSALISRMRRGAPLANAVSWPSMSWKDAMNFRSLENGTTPAIDDASGRCARSRPMRSRAFSTASSTGSTSGPAILGVSEAPAPSGTVDACWRLARAAVRSTRSNSASVTIGPASRSISRPAVHTRTTVISPDVSVFVLSVQTTVVEPSVSTAGSRRTSACRLAIRRMPTASAIVATAGSASGTAATASAIPVSTTSPIGTP